MNLAVKFAEENKKLYTDMIEGFTQQIASYCWDSYQTWTIDKSLPYNKDTRKAIEDVFKRTGKNYTILAEDLAKKLREEGFSVLEGKVISCSHVYCRSGQCLSSEPHETCNSRCRGYIFKEHCHHVCDDKCIIPSLSVRNPKMLAESMK